MTSWRDGVSQQSQDDLDSLLGAVLPLAEQHLAKSGEMYPFGASIDNEGQIAIAGADPASVGEHPLSDSVLEVLYAGARTQSAERRAFAFVADVRASGGDAVRVEVEHREGTALVVLMPYSRSRFKKTVEFGQMSVSRSSQRVWSS